MMQNVMLGGAMIALPIFLQIKLEYDALRDRAVARAALADHVRGRDPRRTQGRRPAPAAIIRAGFALSAVGLALIVPVVPRADTGWYLLVPLVIAGAGLGLLVSQLNNYTLAPIDEERISEAAGVNSAAGSFGLSLGLAVAGGVLLATLSLAFTNMSNASPLIPVAAAGADRAGAGGRRAGREQHAARRGRRRRAARPSRTRSAASTPTRPNLALQVALLVPILAGLIGLFSSFRMVRLPDVAPAAPLDGDAGCSA